MDVTWNEALHIHVLLDSQFILPSIFLLWLIFFHFYSSVVGAFEMLSIRVGSVTYWVGYFGWRASMRQSWRINMGSRAWYRSHSQTHQQRLQYLHQHHSWIIGDDVSWFVNCEDTEYWKWFWELLILFHTKSKCDSHFWKLKMWLNHWDSNSTRFNNPIACSQWKPQIQEAFF